MSKTYLRSSQLAFPQSVVLSGNFAIRFPLGSSPVIGKGDQIYTDGKQATVDTVTVR